MDGRARPEEIAEQARANGDEAVALSDHDEVSGHIAFSRACAKEGVKPILGTEARWLRDITASRRDKTGGYDNSHIVLLAENQTGLRNMWALSSLAYEPANFYRWPQLHPPLMKEYAEGIFASDGCGLSRFAECAEAGDIDGARQEWAVLLDIFGDHFYSELHTFRFLTPPDRALTEDEQKVNAKITAMNQMKVQLAKEMGVPLVVVTDAHYAREDQWDQHRLVWKMNVRNKKDQTEGNAHAADWMMTRDELTYHMGQHGIATSVIEEAIKNTQWIADQCNVEITPTLSMPRLYDTDADDVRAFLDACERGFAQYVTDRGLDQETYFARLEREASLIVDKGFSGYFNVVADYVRSARDGSYRKWVTPGAKPTPCLCGPSRGSAGGSLVAYLLGITGLDPVKHDLMFERFINPDRGADKYEIELDDGDVRVMSAADEVELSNGSRVKVVDLKRGDDLAG